MQLRDEDKEKFKALLNKHLGFVEKHIEYYEDNDPNKLEHMWGYYMGKEVMLKILLNELKHL